MKKEELRNVDGTDSLHPNRSGDVVVVLRPPYQSTRRRRDRRIAFSQFFGQHGYLPDLVDLAHNVNMHAHVRRGRARDPQAGSGGRRPCDRRRADDRVPDGHPRAAERARPDPLRACAASTGQYKEIDDPRHQRLPRPARPARGGGRQPVAAGTRPSRIGGSAFLKPWFDAYRAEAPQRLDSRSPPATRSARRRRSRPSSATRRRSRS